jgi:hypothetical protein
VAGLPTGIWISGAVTAIVLVGWTAWGFREYRRTGRATWLWLGALMAISLVVALTRLPAVAP